MTNMRRLSTIGIGAVAGCAGGLAEIAWVSLYAGLTGAVPSVVARGVTTAAGVDALLPAFPATVGVGVHMTLAALLGVALTLAWQALGAKRLGTGNLFLFMLAALTAVWAVNFLMVLPVVSPPFVHLVPYAVSLMSKLLFGAAAAAVIRHEAVGARSENCFHDTSF